MFKVIRQLAVEFAGPLLIALAWAAYSAHASGDSGPDKLIANFAGAFFFGAWALGQVFRVMKQQRVEAGLGGIESKVQSMLDDLGRKTEDLVGYMTGGNSWCYLMVQVDNANDATGLVSIVHQGKHPLYDVSVRVTDLEAFSQARAAGRPINLGDDRTLNLGNLISGHAVTGVGNIFGSFQGTTKRSFNIFFTARNGSFVQIMRYCKFDGEWLTAMKILRDGEVLHERVSANYPRETDGSVKWD